MEQPDDISSRGMSPRDVRPFMPIAVETCQREVVRVGRVAVLTAMMWSMWNGSGVSRSEELAVFATAGGPLSHVPHEIGIHNLPATEGKPGLDWITASRLPMCR